jgi:branched-chain amino acid transport system ATP-binding protein
VTIRSRDNRSRDQNRISARLGIGLVPRERKIFASLTAERNLTVAARGANGWTLERIHALFPNLAERRRGMGNQLSGVLGVAR